MTAMTKMMTSTTPPHDDPEFLLVAIIFSSLRMHSAETNDLPSVSRRSAHPKSETPAQATFRRRNQGAPLHRRVRRLEARMSETVHRERAPRRNFPSVADRLR